MFNCRPTGKENKTVLSTLTFELEIELAVKYLSDLSGPLGSAPNTAQQKTKDPCWPGGIFWHLNSSVWNPSMLISMFGILYFVHYLNFVGSQFLSQAGITSLIC